MTVQQRQRNKGSEDAEEQANGEGSGAMRCRNEGVGGKPRQLMTGAGNGDMRRNCGETSKRRERDWYR